MNPYLMRSCLVKPCLVKKWIAGVTLMQSVAAVALEDVPVAYLIVAKSPSSPCRYSLCDSNGRKWYALSR